MTVTKVEFSDQTTENGRVVAVTKTSFTFDESIEKLAREHVDNICAAARSALQNELRARLQLVGLGGYYPRVADLVITPTLDSYRSAKLLEVRRSLYTCAASGTEFPLGLTAEVRATLPPVSETVRRLLHPPAADSTYDDALDLAFKQAGRKRPAV